ncbi:MAG: Mrp/NBP35 family ATP-binding protein [Chloroflexi bacterium]|nr:Mrp/NBP35 family ATP-binding protein [Chloroflexota bacterium]
MSEHVDKQQVMDALRTVMDPELGMDLVTLKMVRDVDIQDGVVRVTVTLTTPACPLKSTIEDDIKAAVGQLPGVRDVEVNFDADVATDKRIFGRLSLDVRNIIAVASGKGGVGKTTVAVNLAVALAQEGARVGILDADIYGPNVPLMLGLQGKRIAVRNGKMVPPEAYGVYAISIGFLVPPDTALIWRGPLLHSSIRQLFNDVDWPPLDYMIVDLPPGTGDAHLSLAQSVPVTGGIIVTTPQNVALMDARRGLVAFRELNVPVLGIIENMAGEIFGVGGGEAAARELKVPFLGRVPLDPTVREGSDSGVPVVVSHPDSPTAQAFRELARKVAASVSVLNFQPSVELKVI